MTAPRPTLRPQTVVLRWPQKRDERGRFAPIMRVVLSDWIVDVDYPSLPDSVAKHKNTCDDGG